MFLNWYLLGLRGPKLENRAKLILVFFPCPIVSLSSPTRPERPRSPPFSLIAPVLSLHLWSGNGRLRFRRRRRAATRRTSRPPLPMYVLLISRSFLFFFPLGKKIPFFLFPPAWIDWLVTLLMFPLSSRVEETDLVLHAAVESQQRLHRLQGPFVLRGYFIF